MYGFIFSDCYTEYSSDGFIARIGVSSGISAFMDGSKWFPNWKHSNAWSEKRANRLAADYFKKHYGVVWNDVDNPR